MTTINPASSVAPTFKINKLSTDAKNYISTNDTSKDGVVDFNEFQAAGGLTGDVKSKLTPENLKAVYASFAGSDNLMDAREYGQVLVYIDSRSESKDPDYGNGTISQVESDKFYDEMVEVITADVKGKPPRKIEDLSSDELAFGNGLNYKNITTHGSTLGLDAILPLGTAQTQDLAKTDTAISASDAQSTSLATQSEDLLKDLFPVLMGLSSSPQSLGQDKMKIVLMLILLITTMSQNKG
jgi:hypothetical protein